MRADEGKHPCQEAEVYYYDLLCPDEAAVPEPVRRHVAACPACQEQMHRLREALFEDQRDPGPSRAWDEETIEVLAQQFRLLDQQVTCSDVKPFLPTLALASPQIRIPTPVTVHVDHCLPCAEDLAALRELNLTTDQLKRLSRFFEPSHDRDAGEGRPTPSASGAQEPLRVADADGVACRAVSQADIFDQVIPEPAPSNERRGAIASHLWACPACRERVQALQRRIEAIRKRADAEVATVYHAEGDAGDSYPYLIAVEILPGEQRGDAPVSSASEDVPAGRSKTRKRKYPLPPAGSLAKAAIVVLALAASLGFRWIHAPVASGTNVGDLLKAVAKVPGIHIRKLHRGAEPPTQELWIAYGSNRLVDKTTEHRILYDLSQGRMWTIELEPGVSRPARMSRREHDYARQIMVNAVRNVMEHVSPNTKLRPPTDDAGLQTAERLAVYEVTRTAAGTAPVPLHNRWRVYLDPATELPQKIEFYRESRMSGQTYWDLVTTTEFAYPTEQEMDRDIKAMFPAP